MKFTDGLSSRRREVAEEYPDIEFEDRIVDNMCMQLVQRPEEYDVLVLPNLYGDIVSDLCAGLVGGLGVAPGANIGDDGGGLRGDARLGAEVQGPEQGQPDGDDPLGQADARPPRRDATRPTRLEGAVAAVIAEGKSRDLRHEADPRRPDRRRHERGRRRDHRETERTGTVSERRKVTVVGAGNVGATCAQVLARARLRRRGPRRHQGGPAAGQGARHQPDGRRARLRAERHRLERLRRDRRLRGGRDHRRPAALAGNEPRRPRHDQREDRQGRHREGDRRRARRDPDRRLEPARRDVPRREERLRLPEGARLRQAGILDTARFRPSSPGRPARR